MSQSKETLKFKIVLSGTFWDKVPAYSVLINSHEYASGTTNTEQLVEFSCDLDEDTEHTLEIRLTNKSDNDTVENENKTAILKDMLLNIDSIEIDEIDISELKWSASEFVADDPNRPTLRECVNLGWNGSYLLKFTCPFYLWLLEKL